MSSCTVFLGIVWKVFAVPIFLNSCCMHARDRTTLKGSTTTREVEKEDGSLQPNNIFINHAKIVIWLFSSFHGKCCLSGIKFIPRDYTELLQLSASVSSTNQHCTV